MLYVCLLDTTLYILITKFKQSPEARFIASTL